jgi:hypothetical protein
MAFRKLSSICWRTKLHLRKELFGKRQLLVVLLKREHEEILKKLGKENGAKL